ncbi:class II fructose-bisphosphate aldolase [Clostridium estertheticum]|uniref:class II fructose-bisphosphate aldolase n=1 Tax=Clostridium estertheticum TaxID=238834 RepID=UPI001CF5ED72|nr:class II fructose-bisphosphate aldolase [Clostridium estertheticum]MCB2357361.1 class II fructose-bisphosphate aldolase [Clostridium estertheticum]WAG42346.1 class II fructose-bisphosphate aldolase [Clostridium estertheticum]
MGLVNLESILGDARKNKYAVGAFDVSNNDMAMAVIEVAEELKSPVILMGLVVDLKGDRLQYWTTALRTMAQKASVPVCLHLDHATDVDFIKKAIDSGFTSVMFDGSVLPLEENIKSTKEVVEYAHKFNVSVEAELGHVGDGIVGNSETGAVKDDKDEYDNPDDFLTNPKEMEYFIKSTGIDALAVAVGTAHGVYVNEPKLHFDRLDDLNKISTLPLVMHGGSGTPDEAIKKSVELGICKLNIFSEMLSGFFTSLKEVLNSKQQMSIWPITAYAKPLEAMKDVVRDKMILLGSNNRAK